MTVMMRSRAICTIKRLCLQSLHVGGQYVHVVHRFLSGLHVYCPKAEFRIEPGLQLGLESLRSNHCLMFSTSVLVQESIVRLHAWPALDLMFQEYDRACACGDATSVLVQDKTVYLHGWPGLDLVFQEDDQACACGLSSSLPDCCYASMSP